MLRVGELIRHAAASIGTSVTQFLSDAALTRAHEVLADQRQYTLDAQTWDRFIEVLDRPAVPAPALTDLFAREQQISR